MQMAADGKGLYKKCLAHDYFDIGATPSTKQ